MRMRTGSEELPLQQQQQQQQQQQRQMRHLLPRPHPLQHLLQVGLHLEGQQLPG
jgi:hypothetical protein